MDDDFELNEILKNSCVEPPQQDSHGIHPVHAETACRTEEASYGKLCQFTSGDGIRFFPTGKTVGTLQPAVYEIQNDPQRGIYFEKIPVVTQGLLRFPDSNSERVIQEITDFWEREHLYKQYKLNYKRGIILWGPPGSGKSCTIQLVNQDVINREGVVFKFTHPDLFREGVRMFREIQPDTPMVCLMEDVDSIIQNFNESDVLQILDGVDQFYKVVFLATTNYPQHLGARIMNRPSRFDKRIRMGHPNDASRMMYFLHLFDEETISKYNVDVDKWVEDTEEMSIAHLKELFTSVVILGNEYNSTLKTLRRMIEFHPDSNKDDLDGMGIGFDQMRKHKRRR